MRPVRRFVLVIIMLSAAVIISAQDLSYVRKQLSTLCSPDFYGRGYFHKGDSLASAYLANELLRHGVQSFGESYFQPYSFGVNILNQVSVKLNDKELTFGTDFMTDASSGSVSGNFRPLMVNATLMKRPQKLIESLDQFDQKEKLIILDSAGLNNPGLYQMVKTLCLNGKMGIKGLIEVSPKIGIGLVGNKEMVVSHINIRPEVVPDTLKSVSIQIQNHFDPAYSTRNVIGFIKGKTDKFIVFTAHYDGIGSFGDGNLFPAASDNASGTSMVLDLARYFSKGRKPYYSIAFMLFSGEEAGLKGSSYYVDHPCFRLIRLVWLLIWTWLGTGQEGSFLFNGKERPREAAMALSINEKNHYLKELDIAEGKANSDHFPFHKNEVPAIFFLTKGSSGGGHNTADTVDKLPLYAYKNLFHLILDFLDELQTQELD